MSLLRSWRLPTVRALPALAAATIFSLGPTAPAQAQSAATAEGRIAERYFPRHLDFTGPLPTLIGMNNHATVIATRDLNFDYTRPQPYRRFSEGAEERLPLLPQGTAGAPTGINDQHESVGWVQIGRVYKQGWRAVRWTAEGQAVDLAATLPAGISAAYGINASGQVVGSFAETPSSPTKTVVWSSDGRPRFLRKPLHVKSMLGRAINSTGHVAGLVHKGGFFPVLPTGEHGGFYATPDGAVHRFGPASDVTAMNDRGQVIGSAWDVERRSHAFVWEKSMGRKVKQLPMLPDYTYCHAHAISNDGVIVGSCTRSTGGGGLFWRKAVAWEQVGAEWRVVDLSQRVQGGDHLHEHDHLVAVGIDVDGRILLNMESGAWPLEPSLLVPLGL